MSVLITIQGLYKYTHTGLKYHQKRHVSLCGSPSPFDPPNPVSVPIIPLQLSDYLYFSFRLWLHHGTKVRRPWIDLLLINIGFYAL